jgi:prenyltransferase beta subunit
MRFHKHLLLTFDNAYWQQFSMHGLKEKETKVDTCFNFWTVLSIDLISTVMCRSRHR